MTVISADSEPAARPRELTRGPERVLELGGSALLANRVWSRVVNSPNAVTYSSEGQTIDFDQLAQQGEALDYLKIVGGTPNVYDDRFNAIGGRIAAAVRLDPVPRERTANLRRWYLPDVTDDNRQAIAKGIDVLRKHFPNDYLKLYRKVALASLSNGLFQIGDNGGATTFDVSRSIEGFAFLLTANQGYPVVAERDGVETMRVIGKQELEKLDGYLAKRDKK